MTTPAPVARTGEPAGRPLPARVRTIRPNARVGAAIGAGAPTAGERDVASAVRLVIDRHESAPTRPDPATRPAWLMDAAAAAVRAVGIRQPKRTSTVDVEGFANIWLHRFTPPTGYRYAARDLAKAIVDLPPETHSDATHRHHPNRPRLAFFTPAGLVLDEIRTGPDWDDVLDRWLAPKLLADFVAGAALAGARGVPFVGVRILPLAAPRRAKLARAGAVDGAIELTELDRVDLTAPAPGATVMRRRAARRAGEAAPGRKVAVS